MTSLKHRLLFLWAILIQGCLAVLQIEPVTDDLDDRSEYYRTEYYPQPYETAKRSFIYPQYDVERFASTPEAEHDEKRDSIKGPSIDPIIEDNEPLDVDVEDVDLNRALRTPHLEIEENGQRLSEISRESKKSDNRKHGKISEKEKEAISAGLIKLLYDWKLHRGHGTSGSGSKESLKSKQVSGESTDGNEAEIIERNHSQSPRANGNDLAEINDKKKSTDIVTNQDPLSESKSNPNVIMGGRKVPQEAGVQEETSTEADDGSSELSSRKTKGKINVLVNVNINERSLRSKVSRASKSKQKKNFSKNVPIYDVRSVQNTNDDDDDFTGEGEDDDDNEEDDVNAKGKAEYGNNSAYLSTNNSSTKQPGYQVNVMRQAQTVQTNVSTGVPNRLPGINTKSKYDDSYRQRYSFNYVTTISATNATPTSGSNRLSSETGEETSGDDEYDDLEEKIQEDGASGLDGHLEGADAIRNSAKPSKTQNKQPSAQKMLPDAGKTMTRKNVKKEGRKGDESLVSNEKQASVEDSESDEIDQENENQETIDESENNPKQQSIRKNHPKRHKSKKIMQEKQKPTENETFKQLSTPKEKSTATPKFSKPKENPKVVTKSTDDVGKIERPQEATNEMVKGKDIPKVAEKFGAETNEIAIETQREEKYGTRKNISPEKTTEIPPETDEKAHFVKLHNSEIQLLKEHRAKLQLSEPIVIDDIRKKNGKPKANPKEATKLTQKESATTSTVKQGDKESKEASMDIKPTTKRNFVTAQKPEVVVPLKEKDSSKDKTDKETVKEKNQKNGFEDTVQNGSGDDEPKKYGSLKSVRERFKAWEKEMISRLSNPFLKDVKHGSGEEKQKNKSYKTWSDEEKELISRLSNPFLHQKTNELPKGKDKKVAEKVKKKLDDNKDEKRNNATESTKNAVKNEELVAENLKSTLKDDKSTAAPISNDETSFDMPTDNGSGSKQQKIDEVKPNKDVMQSFVPGNDKKQEPTEQSLKEKDVDLQQLEKFKEQITTEVSKINKLEEEYKKNMLKSKELKDAKETLTKDLKYIKDIEMKLEGGLKKSHGQKEKEVDMKFVAKENKPKTEKAKEKQDPLVKIQGLLQAEMMRSKSKKEKGEDRQLENIRGLLKQELKKLIKSGRLGSSGKLPSGLQKLSNMIHQKLSAAKKKKKRKQKKKKSKKNKAVHGKQLKNSLEFVKEYKPTVAGSNRGYITTMSKYKAAMEALKTLKEQQQEAATLNSNVSSSAFNSSESTKPHVVMPKNLPTGAQAEQFKDLLKNLNKKIGEVYSRLQSTTQRQQSNAPGNNQQTVVNNGISQGMNYVQPTVTASNPLQQPQEHNLMPQGATPITSSFNQPQVKQELPVEPEEPKDEPEPDTVLAEAEPVETLIENLEKDITDVWSFKDQYPDAMSLGLDNDKIHKTYANLGSLSGLNLRRSLERALRGRDVGLVIVGGSISKGGPFSEKGVDYALKTYFYAIADWWNKVIRPITGSGMVIRDASIGGIATDYYAYCLRSHVPDDRLNNIVLWELSANDMHRYDDGLRPKQQSLEQFTQEVLSFKAKPALIYLNFFALFSWDQDLVTHCRNFEDEGEGEIAKHYKITSLSWRDMVCSLMQDNKPLFTRDELFSEDKFHPSIEAHAQMAYVIIDYIRTEFLKNLVKQRFLEIGDAARKLKIPETVYVPKPMYKQTFTWKPHCYTYMIVDNKEPNNTLSVKEEINGDFHYTILREFKIRSDKIIGMETKKSDQFITYEISVPVHRNGEKTPYKGLAIMSFTDDREAEVQFDNSPLQRIETAKKFLEGTVLKYVASDVTPGNHKLTIKSGPNGFIISAIMLG